jgi:hypothetical protein
MLPPTGIVVVPTVVVASLIVPYVEKKIAPAPTFLVWPLPSMVDTSGVAKLWGVQIMSELVIQT